MQKDRYGVNFHKVRANIICYFMVVVLISGLFAYFTPINAKAYTEKTGVVTGVYDGSSLNIRSGPGTSYASVGSLINGVSVTIIDEELSSTSALWYKIRFINASGVEATGYVYSNYITIVDTPVYTPDADFEAYLNSQGFLESYKPLLRTLHAKYPKWVFIADKIDYNWDDVVNNQNLFGRSLIAKSSISSWKSTDSQAFNYLTNTYTTLDGGAWVAASKELISYALDPRNFLDETYIFQFESLSFNEAYHTRENILNVIKNSFLATNSIRDDETGLDTPYVDIMLKVAKKTGVSPFYMAASIIQEMGSTGASGSISGNYSENGRSFAGLYNYFNWGAYEAGGLSPIANGLIYAFNGGVVNNTYYFPWDTRYKSLLGGTVKFAKGYIDAGQDTAYYKKFDFVGTPYTHQYMTHIIAGYLEGAKIAKGYTDTMKKDSAFVFKIPVYKNMPESISAKPTKDGSPNNALSSLTVSTGNLTPDFNYSTMNYSMTVENSVNTINIGAQKVEQNAIISGIGTKNLNVGLNVVDVSVTAQNGDVRKYTLNIIRKEGFGEETTSQTPTTQPVTQPTTTITPPVILNPIVNSLGIRVDDSSSQLSNIGIGSTVDNVLSNLLISNGSIRVLDKNLAVKAGKVGTGDKVQILNNIGSVSKEYDIVIYGDATGDGSVDLKDALAIRKHILGINTLSGIYAFGADANKAGDGINLKDALIIRKHILSISSITQ
jgi:beta-N-acetylglucosaminidase